MSPRCSLLYLTIISCILGALAAPSVSDEGKDKVHYLGATDEHPVIPNLQKSDNRQDLHNDSKPSHLEPATEDVAFEDSEKQLEAFKEAFEENSALGALKKVQIVATDEDTEVVEALKEPSAVDQLKIDQGIGDVQPRVYYRGAQLWRIAFHDQKSKNAVAILHSTYSNGNL